MLCEHKWFSVWAGALLWPGSCISDEASVDWDRSGQAVPGLHMFLHIASFCFCGNLDGVIGSGKTLD